VTALPLSRRLPPGLDLLARVVELEKVVDQVALIAVLEEARLDQPVGKRRRPAEQSDPVGRHHSISESAIGPADRQGQQPDPSETLAAKSVELRVVVEPVVQSSPGHQRATFR
jgi:hypothetical protein